MPREYVKHALRTPYEKTALFERHLGATGLGPEQQQRVRRWVYRHAFATAIERVQHHLDEGDVSGAQACVTRAGNYLRKLTELVAPCREAYRERYQAAQQRVREQKKPHRHRLETRYTDVDAITVRPVPSKPRTEDA